MSQTKIWAIIPAAGTGSRFSQHELKQYQIIQNKTVLEHTVQRLNHLPLAGYVLAISEQDNFAKNINFTHSEKRHFCVGGKERVNSVLNALHYLQNFASEQDWVLVHDAARPCVAPESLDLLLSTALTTQQSAILAIPVRDTLKKSLLNDTSIERTISREHLWQAQTPQIAPFVLLKQAIESALKANVTLTDEASALEYTGKPVQLVQGRSDNIKITYPDDLYLAKLILAAQNENS